MNCKDNKFRITKYIFFTKSNKKGFRLLLDGAKNKMRKELLEYLKKEIKKIPYLMCPSWAQGLGGGIQFFSTEQQNFSKVK